METPPTHTRFASWVPILAIGAVVILIVYAFSYLSRTHEREEMKVRSLVADSVITRLKQIATEADPRDHDAQVRFNTLGTYLYTFMTPADVDEWTGTTPEQIYRQWVR